MILVLALVAVIPVTTLLLQRQTSNYTKASNPNPGFTNTITGYVEDVSCNNGIVKGFVCDSDNFSKPVLIRIWLIDKDGQKTFLDGSAIWSSEDSPNSDLACAGTLNHGFTYTVPDSLKSQLEGSKVQIVAWNIDINGSMDNTTVELPGSPKTVSCISSSTTSTPQPTTTVPPDNAITPVNTSSSSSNFKYLGIYHTDFYKNSWSQPIRFNDNLNLADRNLHNILLPVFNPGPDQNYFDEAQKRNLKLIVDLAFLLDPGENSKGKYFYADWQTRFASKLDLYKKNSSLIYAFYIDEPYLHQVDKSQIIEVTKTLKNTFPNVGIMAIEFWPYLTSQDKYDKDYFSNFTDIGLDKYDSYFEDIKGDFERMKTLIPDKKLWLVPQSYVDKPEDGPFTTPQSAKELITQFIDYAKNDPDNRIVGMLLYDYSIESLGSSKKAVAGFKEMINTSSAYFSPGYEQLIKDTVTELKSKTPIILPTITESTPTIEPTAILSSTTPSIYNWKVSIDFKCANGSVPNDTSSFKVNYAFWPDGPGRAVYDPSWQETVLPYSGGSILAKRSDYSLGNAYLFASDVGETYLTFYSIPDSSKFTTGGLFGMPQNSITKWSYFTPNTQPLSFTFQVPPQYCQNTCSYTTPPSGCSYQDVQCFTAPCCKQLVCPNTIPGDLDNNKLVNLDDFIYWKLQYEASIMTLGDFLSWKEAYAKL